MTKKAAESNLVRARSVARVDDWLVERHDSRVRLLELLDNAPADAEASAAEIRRLRKKSRQCSENAIRGLLEIYVAEAGHRGELAFHILGDFPDSQLQPILATALASTTLGREAKLKLLALSAFENERDFSTEHAFEAMSVQPSELVEAFNSAVADMLEPEEIALMWLQDFWDLPRDEKLSLVSFFIDQANARFFPAIELEAYSPNVDVRRTIVRGLHKFQFREAKDLAERMLEDRNPTIRFDAQKQLTALSSIVDLQPYYPPPIYETCYCLATPEHGLASLLYAVRDRRNRIKFCSILIDCWNKGISDCWGNVGLPPAKFDEVISDFIHEAAGFGISGDETFQEIPRDYALYLIHEGLKLGQARRGQLPVEFRIWERLFRYETFRFDPASSLMKFGLTCSNCDQPVYANRRRSNLFVKDSLVVCRKCLTLQRTCENCGRDYKLADILVTTDRRAYRGSTCGQCWEDNRSVERNSD